MTQMEQARRGCVTALMAAVAAMEHVSAETVREEVAGGRAVLPANPAHGVQRPAIVGRRFRTKINANIGCSGARSEWPEEREKLQAALELGVDFVMDLSVGARACAMRAAMLKSCPVPLGTVPIYEAVRWDAHGEVELDAERLLDVVAEQAAQGVDFMTLHAGLLRRHLAAAARRVMGIVSRGGALMAAWMDRHGRENPLYERWDRVLDICRAHDVTVSLGDGLRPGCLADASDEAQFAELEVLGNLVRRCREAGVQVMVEGPGHIPFHEIEMNMRKAAELCDGAPFYVLGPVVTDIAPGYDHITSSIGATAAACYGASLLCYVTPAEHLGLPTLEEVRQGVVAHRIAAHAGDVARGLAGARAADDAMARARVEMDWPRQFALAIDPVGARARYEQTRDAASDPDHCSMCGRDFCAIRTTRRWRNGA